MHGGGWRKRRKRRRRRRSYLLTSDQIATEKKVNSERSVGLNMEEKGADESLGKVWHTGGLEDQVVRQNLINFHKTAKPCKQRNSVWECLFSWIHQGHHQLIYLFPIRPRRNCLNMHGLLSKLLRSRNSNEMCWMGFFRNQKYSWL